MRKLSDLTFWGGTYFDRLCVLITPLHLASSSDMQSAETEIFRWDEVNPLVSGEIKMVCSVFQSFLVSYYYLFMLLNVKRSKIKTSLRS